MFNALLEAKLSVEVELGEPSVSDVLSRLVEVFGNDQIKTIEESFLFELRQGKQESLHNYARRVGVFKTLALKQFSAEHWASNCLSGLTDEYLRDIVKYPAQINVIVRELERQEALEQELNRLWSKMHRVQFCGARAADYDKAWSSTSTDSEGAISDRTGEKVFRPTILTKETVRSNEDVEDLFWIGNSGLSVKKQSTGVDWKITEFPEANGLSDTDQQETGEKRVETHPRSGASSCLSPEREKKNFYDGRVDCENVWDEFVSPNGGTVARHYPCSQTWSEGSDAEWSDDEKDEIWSELDSDDDSYCPYQPLTLEEALRQIEDGKKTSLAGKKSDNPTLLESRCGGISGPVFDRWINGGTESLRPACEVGSGKIRVASVCFERRIQLTDQKSLVIESNEIKTGSAAVHYWKEAVSREMKAMAVDRVGEYGAKMTPERCPSIMIQPSEVEVEVGRSFSQSAQSVRKPVLGVLSVKGLTVQDDRFDGDPDDGMIEEMLREIEELDESHRLSDEDETIIDALLEEQELENADQGGGEHSEFLDVEEVPVPCTGVYKVSAECICDVTKATGRSGTDIEAEGKCSFQSTEVDCSHEQHYCQIPDEVIPQRPALTRRKQFWVPHRKHSRRKTEDQQKGLQRLCWPTHRKHGRWKHARQQMGLRGLCWPTHRKHGRWKPGQTVMSPLQMQLRPNATRRWCSQRKRTKWKSSNRERGNACPQDDAAMYVKLYPPNT